MEGACPRRFQASVGHKDFSLHMKRSRLSLIARAISLPFISAILIGSPALPAQAATPAFVQVAAAVPQSLSVTTISAAYAAAQTAGNLNVVVIGWNDTAARVSTVTDTSGNVSKQIGK